MLTIPVGKESSPQTAAGIGMAEPRRALSLRQPWAALLVADLKEIEIRTWKTSVRGPVLVHTGKLPDPRPDGWLDVAEAGLEALAALRGGVIGAADLVECLAYRTAEAFVQDRHRHRNAADWFRPPVLFGFRFVNARPVRFIPHKGSTFFFPVEGTSLS